MRQSGAVVLGVIGYVASAASTRSEICPYPLSHAKRHRGRAAKALMHVAEIVVHDVQRDRRAVVLQPPAKAVAEARETL